MYMGHYNPAINIIAHIDAQIKVSTENFAGYPISVVSADDDTSSKWTKRKNMAKERALKMLLAGYAERATRIMACSDVIQYKYCPECKSYMVQRASLCRDKLCPVCSWRLAIQRCNYMRQMLSRAMLDIPSSNMYFLTITVTNCTVDKLSACMSAMSTAWNRVTNRKTFKKAILGWAKSAEITYNAEQWTLHPHYHILLQVDPQLQCDVMSLPEIWCNSFEFEGVHPDLEAQNIKECKIIHSEEGISLQKQYIKSILEAYKYTFKDSDLDAMPLEIFRLFARQVDGKRMISFGGTLKAIKAQIKADFDNNIEQKEIQICEHCGADGLIDQIARWSFSDNQYHAITNHLSLIL